jgi:hypothetical protein
MFRKLVLVCHGRSVSAWVCSVEHAPPIPFWFDGAGEAFTSRFPGWRKEVRSRPLACGAVATEGQVRVGVEEDVCLALRQGADACRD